jgi:hypothetical protein
VWKIAVTPTVYTFSFYITRGLTMEFVRRAALLFLLLGLTLVSGIEEQQVLHSPTQSRRLYETTSIVLSNSVVGASTVDATISFTAANVGDGASLEITFPSAFTLNSGFTKASASLSGVEPTNAAVSGQTLTVTNAITGNTDIVLTLTGVITTNPGVSGATDDFTLVTKDGGSTTLESDSTVSGPTITTASLPCGGLSGCVHSTV